MRGVLSLIVEIVIGALVYFVSLLLLNDAMIKEIFFVLQRKVLKK